jgi:predicted  nucleic acid-binding Zn-ribbon protein
MTATAILDLQKAGFSRDQVEALARLFETQAATKSDIGDLKSDISALEAKVTTEVARLEVKITQVKADLEVKIADTKSDLIRWVVGVGFAQVATLIGALFAFLRMFPSVHP